MSTVVGGVNVAYAFEEFCRKQEEIYNRSFRDKQLASLEPARLVKEGASGYLVAWQYSEDVTPKIAEFGQVVAREYPFLCYPADFLHTTISDYGVVFDSEAEPDKNVLGNLSRAVYDALNLIWKMPSIIQSGWFFSKDTVIVAGYPDVSFVRASLAIQDSARKLGIELRLPWGGHITVGRFTGSVNDPEKIQHLRELLASAPCGIGEVKPVSIVIGRFVINSCLFNIEVFRRFTYFPNWDMEIPF